ncbi:MAG: A24 family peptidase [Parafannyhessea umbonata]|uniref:prepilin peptidase n=1 Tax=Parafannyhessea umbonata TaxID=604330 RepID=UPI0026EA3579|nr:A24 family peptidase [Parafannyhessea umbonata]MCI7218007.1 A24 family peptidase [Parafannyhessea umbonata]MDD6565878.1 A24 family peptidase [Parafannyhessea umbonata]
MRLGLGACAAWALAGAAAGALVGTWALRAAWGAQRCGADAGGRRPSRAARVAMALAGAFALGAQAWALVGGGVPGMGTATRGAAVPEVVGTMVLCGCLVALSAFDLVQMRIPNSVLAVAVATRLVCLAWEDVAGGAGPAEAALWIMARMLCAAGVLVAAMLFSLAAARALGPGCVGGGDVKLVAVTALYLGPAQMVLMLALASVLGLVFGLAWTHRARRIRRTNAQAGPHGARRDAFPWGPALAASCWVALLLGERGARVLLGVA